MIEQLIRDASDKPKWSTRAIHYNPGHNSFQAISRSFGISVSGRCHQKCCNAGLQVFSLGAAVALKPMGMGFP